MRKDTRPLTLTFEPDNDVVVQLGEPAKADFELRLGKQPRTLLNSATFTNGVLTGRFAGRIPTEDAGGWRHSIALNLRLVTGAGAARLRGSGNAETSIDPVYYSLASYVELTKR